MPIKIFRYLPDLDAFLPTDEYIEIAEQLGICEWNPVVWIGRLFCRDNDYGEHWFDNWDEREAIAEKAKKVGFDSHDLLIINPLFFRDEADGPCHSDEVRKQFWTDVLKSLELSVDVLCAEARMNNNEFREVGDDDYIADLEERIQQVKDRYRKA